MTDALTNKPMEVVRGGESTAMLYVAVSQLPAVQALFDRNEVNYWLTLSDVPVSDTERMRGVILSRNENHDRVQTLLDSAP